MKLLECIHGDYEEVPRRSGIRHFRFICTRPYHTKAIVNGVVRSVTVPEGFLSDGASSPVATNAGYAWIIHDWCYAKHEWDDGRHMTRVEADKLMRLILRHETRWLDAFCWYAAMRLNLMRLPGRAWKDSRRQGPMYGFFSDRYFVLSWSQSSEEREREADSNSSSPERWSISHPS